MKQIKVKRSNQPNNYKKTKLDLEIEKELLESKDNNKQQKYKRTKSNPKWLYISITFILIMMLLRIFFHIIF